MKDHNSKEALSDATRLLTVVIKLFPNHRERVKIFKGGRDCYYNYDYHVGGTKGDYVIAVDHYGSDCIRVPRLLR